MKLSRVLPGLAAVAAMAVTPVAAQGQQGNFGLLVAQALAAAGNQHTALFQTLCPFNASTFNGQPLASLPTSLPAIPGAEEWMTEPVRVFDNLFYVGQTEYSAWAVDTGEGLIVIDALFDYSAEGSIADGLRKLGYDPSDIEYLIVSHGHSDHVGGAAHLQQTYGARVVMSEADWDLVEKSTADWPKPTRDIVAADGQEIALGDVTVKLYLTPGHTPGTLSAIISPIRDGNETHVAAAWGGTAFNFRGTAEIPRSHWLTAYAESAARFRDLVDEAGADVLIANHPRFDRTPTKVPLLRGRRPGQPHPYVIGVPMVERYLTVAEACAQATLVVEGG